MLVTLFVILGVIGGIVAFFLILAGFLKKDYTVQRKIMINRPRAVVFDYIRHLKNQPSYSKWDMMDPDCKREYAGTDGTVGFVSRWESDNKKVGSGWQEIVSIAGNSRMDVNLHFIKPFEANSKAYFIAADAGNESTEVTWAFEGSMKYPMNIMLMFMNMEGMLGKDLQTGLENMKKNLEK